ncbi:hypothetical protein [Desulfopila sp. IMCC35008]|uniref:hypothetical protein n=1 Tax=Desulfopila sp. IMCC35008 TaxID=2653858 RepID=UPI0013D31D67|nr:hypothetical protein [Desulfopila sp. IMCC35008]
MTSEQRHDLEVEWQVTSTRLKQMITEEYHKKFGSPNSNEHWEAYLVEALNLKRVWKAGGLM